MRDRNQDSPRIGISLDAVAEPTNLFEFRIRGRTAASAPYPSGPLPGDARSFLAPAALLGKARCLENLGFLDEAIMAYDDILVNYPEGSWAQTADANKKVILSKKQ